MIILVFTNILFNTKIKIYITFGNFLIESYYLYNDIKYDYQDT